MELIMFFGLMLIALILSYFYYGRGVVYMGVFAGMIFLFNGILLATGESLTNTTCFHEIENTTISGNSTTYDYADFCHVENYEISSDMKLALGLIMMIIGSFMITDFISVLR